MSHNFECPYEEAKKEWKRLVDKDAKPCPDDFPEKLKPLWKGFLEYSSSPLKVGYQHLNKINKINKIKNVPNV
tara:strand:- start:4027 stop:4245 length:219 start_codon:yes stop_codon:yes gene_type:complete